MTQLLPAAGMTKVYDDRGKACIPADVRSSFGVEKGDKFQVQDAGDHIKFVPVEEEEESEEEG